MTCCKQFYDYLQESGKGSRVSSGTSSLSPHNSMEGSPRMIPKSNLSKTQASPSSKTNPKNKYQSEHSSSGARSLVVLENTSSEGKYIRNQTSEKKTIRNYTPKESINMLQVIESNRNNSVDGRSKQNKKPVTNKTVTKPSPSESKIKEEKSKTNGTKLERKSSMERMIDDFHRNLPPPPPDPRIAAIAQPSLPNSSNTSSINDRTNPSSTKSRETHEVSSNPRGANRSNAVKPDGSSAPPNPINRHHQNVTASGNKHGTLTSQVSNWSVASSSAASFDYQPGINSGNAPSNATSYNRRKSLSTDNLLPALSEVEYGSNKDNFGGNSPNDLQSRIGERVPPEGCAAVSTNSPQPQTSSPFVQRIEVKGSPNKRAPVKAERKALDKKFDAKPSNDKSSSNRADAEPDDEFSNLRKMIKEGRIAGLDAPPPSFIPPTPPSTSKMSFSSKSSATASSSSSPKPNVPSDNISETRNTRNNRNPHPKLVERSSSSITG